MNNIDMTSGSPELIALTLDGSQIEGIKEFHAVRSAAGWSIQFVVEPGYKKAPKLPDDLPGRRILDRDEVVRQPKPQAPAVKEPK